MQHVASVLFQMVGTALFWLCIGVAALKVIWNLGLPYAMLREPEGRGWSAFPLVEMVPLLIAAACVFIGVRVGSLTAFGILLAGTTTVLLSYAHLFIVVFIAGWSRRNRDRKTGHH